MNRTLLIVLCSLGLWSGCGTSEPNPQPAAQNPSQPKPQTKPQTKPTQPAIRSATASKDPKPKEETSEEAIARNFLSSEELQARLKVGRIEPEVQFTPDPAKLEAAGIRTLEGKHVRIYTDLESSPEIDELPQVFDAAFPQWCEYFRVDPVANADWKINAVLMSGKEKFRAAGLFPDSLPKFLHGYYQGDSAWLLDQPSDYYRRHLLLHEGTHAFMYILLGGAGPPWYMEGMAEHFGTHTWKDGVLTTRVMPASKEETPMWGRLKIIQDEVKGGKTLSLTSVMATPNEAFLENKPYAWSWGVCAFLDNNSLSKETFRDMVPQVKLTGGFSSRLFNQLGDVMPQLSESWQLFTLNAEYGYDWQRNEVVYKPPVLIGDVTTAEIATDRGWQSTGIALEPNVEYELRAVGQYVIRNDGQPWMCEPNGVTIHYWKGKPLGMLVGAYRVEQWDGTNTLTPLAKETAVGYGTPLTPEDPSTLFLKVNESPAELADNQGKIQIQVKRVPKSTTATGQ